MELTLLSGARELGSCRNDFAISGGLCPLGQYTYTPWEDAVYAGGDKAIRLTVSDGCYLEVYEDSNLISYCRSDGSLLGRYMASGAGLGDGSNCAGRGGLALRRGARMVRHAGAC